jgi:DNA-nicking Smr family endonuclease
MGHDPDPHPIPITGELDLHTFQPKELGVLIPAYLEACRNHNLRSVRIVHGKGTGALRSSTHSLLDRSALVLSYRPGDETSGGWGATLVTLRP